MDAAQRGDRHKTVEPDLEVLEATAVLAALMPIPQVRVPAADMQTSSRIRACSRSGFGGSRRRGDLGLCRGNKAFKQLRFHSDPEGLGDTPVFVGTRVPARALIDYLERGQPLAEFLDDFPSVTHEKAVAALELARATLLPTGAAP